MNGNANGAHAIPAGLGQVGNPEVIGVLEKLMADARAGNIAGLGVVLIGANGAMNIITCGSAPPPFVHAGAAIMQSR